MCGDNQSGPELIQRYRVEELYIFEFDSLMTFGLSRRIATTSRSPLANMKVAQKSCGKRQKNTIRIDMQHFSAVHLRN